MDLKEMLEICEKATPGPWNQGQVNNWDVVYDKNKNPVTEICKHYTQFGYQGHIAESVFNNANFIASSREGWPYAIIRVMEAEELLNEYYKRKHLLCNECSPLDGECEECKITKLTDKTKQFLEAQNV
jgi:hypothetical protein